MQMPRSQSIGAENIVQGVRLGHVLLDALGSPAQNAQREVSRGVTARALHVLRGTFLFG